MTEPLRVEFVTELDRLALLADRWEALNAQRTAEAPVFQSYGWISHVARLRADAAGDRFRIKVATVWRGADLVGIWPLAETRGYGAWIARSLDDSYGQFSGILFRSPSDAVPGVALILDELRKTSDGLVIESVIAGSPLHEALRQSGARTVSGQQAVYVDISGCRSFTDFEQRMKGETRRRLRNRTKKLRQAFTITHEVVSGAAALAELVGRVYEGRLAWLQRNGRASPSFRDPAFKQTLLRLPAAPGVELLGFRLAEGDREISLQWGFVYGGTYYWYMSAMNEGYDDYSPGLLHLGMVIEACIARGLQWLEFMPPASRYKLEWSDLVRDVETMALPLTLKGRAVLEMTNTVLPAVRRLSRKLPEPVRRRLVRAVAGH